MAISRHHWPPRSQWLAHSACLGEFYNFWLFEKNQKIASCLPPGPLPAAGTPARRRLDPRLAPPGPPPGAAWTEIQFWNHFEKMKNRTGGRLVFLVPIRGTVKKIVFEFWKVFGQFQLDCTGGEKGGGGYFLTVFQHYMFCWIKSSVFFFALVSNQRKS